MCVRSNKRPMAHRGCGQMDPAVNSSHFDCLNSIS
jgi:hypothetical protein